MLKTVKKLSECKLYVSDSTLAELERQKSGLTVVKNGVYIKSAYLIFLEGSPVFVDNNLDFGEFRIE